MWISIKNSSKVELRWETVKLTAATLNNFLTNYLVQ